MKKIIKVVWVVTYFVSVLMVIFFALVFCKPFFGYEYKVNNTILFSNLSEKQYKDYSMQIIDYFFNNNVNIRVLRANGTEIKGYFTEREVKHMRDVKSLIRFFLLFTALCIVFSVVTILKISQKRDFLATASFSSIMLILLLLTLQFVNFNSAFIVFHKIFFRNDYWLLPENTKLIEMFPEKFFYDFAKVWLSLFLGFNGAIYFASGFLNLSKNA